MSYMSELAIEELNKEETSICCDAPIQHGICTECGEHCQDSD